jgi:DNA (cytosine-5)-methyltransferase 1
MFKHLDLFSGIGGFSLGLESTGGFETVAFCEIEKFPRKILKKHWPHVKQYKDIKELTNEQLETDGIIPIDIITGGYPCQPFSVAGRKLGEKDKRHLWPEMFRLVKECRPTWVVGENVSGHIKLGLDTVLEDLESEGYSTRAFSISASSIGANHKRERVWIVANSDNTGNRTPQHEINRNGEKTNERQERQSQPQSSRQSKDMENSRRTLRQGSLFGGENENEIRKENADQFERSSSSSENGISNTDSQRLQGLGSERKLRESQKERSFSWERWWEFEPDVGRVAHGVPKRMDRLKGLGNSLVPAIPFIIGNSILKTEENNERI